jgi:1-acyl-sn-glycerol-3-phosphate acyltransferase
VTVCGTLSLPTIPLTGDGRFGHRLFARRWGRFILRWCGVRLTVEGKEHLDAERPAVIVANHPSHYAFYALAAALPLQWRAVMRRGMRRIPIFGFVGEKAGHVFIRLGDAALAVADLQAGIDRLRAGYWLLVFPEGEPSPPGHVLPFKQGAFRLAIESGVDVIPVALDERYPRGGRPGWDAAPASIALRIGKPIPTASLNKGDAGILAARARDEILGVIA